MRLECRYTRALATSVATFLPRRYQVTVPAFRLAVKLPPSMYSVTSRALSSLKQAP